MIAKLIRWSVHNRFLVLVVTGLIVAGGLYAVRAHRWTPSPICPTSRSSSRPPIPARRRRWWRIR